ncbi:MAG: hypothetical protein DRP27_07740, partial [Thermotogae bacterium]
MREVIKYRCKDCEKEITIPKQVYNLMLQKGESLPERCEACRKKHEEIRKEIKCPYFQVKLESESNFTDFDYYKSAYTFHGDRPRQTDTVEPDS